LKPLSFIIITYNRPDDALELIQNISSLNKAGDLMQDIIVVNNASSSDYSMVKDFIGSSALPFYYIDAPENLGVTKGRNFALKHAQGEVVIFLDDDAILQNEDALENVLTAFEKQQYEDREVAIVSFKVLYYDNLEMQKNALPHKQFDKYSSNSEFFTYYFAGGAHAIKRKVLDEVNGLPDDFYYGMEEYDLSYRILDRNYCIKYDASIVMLHKESRLGRKPRKDIMRMMWVNKTKVSYRYLPKIYFYSTAILWSFQYLSKVGFDLSGWLNGWKQIFKIPSTEKRMLLQPSTLKYLKHVEARLWY
jgi:GT2 family glycosyltransferase